MVPAPHGECPASGSAVEKVEIAHSGITYKGTECSSLQQHISAMSSYYKNKSEIFQD